MEPTQQKNTPKTVRQLSKVVAVKKKDDLICWFVVTFKTYWWHNDFFLDFKFKKDYVLLESTAINTLSHETQIVLESEIIRI